MIGTPSSDHPDIYTVALTDGTTGDYSDSSNIFEAIPDTNRISPSSIFPGWFQGDANATLLLFDMIKPRHGKLQIDSDNNWIFYPGINGGLKQGMKLPDLSTNGHMLMGTCQLIRNCFIQHVSSHGLTFLLAPSSLQLHTNMCSADKEIWDAAYDECMMVLLHYHPGRSLLKTNFECFISMKTLPTMAMATINYK